jgi:hypothetical protein
MKLNPEDLTVSSFETEATAIGTGTIVIIKPNDPTANTWCYICPVETQDARCF